MNQAIAFADKVVPVAVPLVLMLLAFLGMSMGIGRTLLSNSVVPGTRVSADGSPDYKPGGVTLDWSTVTAVGSDTNLPEGGGAFIKSGTKYLRFGQVITKITASGKYGPYDPAAVDGRQLLVIGNAFVIDETITEYSAGISGISAQLTEIGAIEGGLIFIDRIIQSGVAAHTLALGPTLAEFLAVFPRFRPSAKD